MMKKHKLVEIEWPQFGEATPPPKPSLAEHEARLEATRAAMARKEFTHLLVYGDREHFANLHWLTGFDPRFEEALMVIRQDRRPLLIVGTECVGYLPISPLWAAGKLRHERFRSFSLVSTPRGDSRQLREILADEGIGPEARVGCAGWKYYSAAEHSQGEHTLDLPAYLADAARELAGFERVFNAAALFIDPDTGLRTFCSPAEIAWMEYTNILASEGMKRMLFNLRDGMTDLEVGRLAGFNGLPLACHPTLKTGDKLTGLSSPRGDVVRRGDRMSANLSYWGSNCCRAGWVVASAQELPSEIRDYADAFAGPYFMAMSEWFGLLQIGRPGGDLDRLIRTRLPHDKYGIELNAGHLIHFDEWTSSPVCPDSPVPLHSGMAVQSDVIPSSPVYYSTRMEDTYVLADQTLRAALQEAHPACFARCERRRAFMAERLGIALSTDVLPLSNIPAIVPPFFLNPRLVLAREL
jgi:Xaa-Pro aminopeptidase